VPKLVPSPDRGERPGGSASSDSSGPREKKEISTTKKRGGGKKREKETLVGNLKVLLNRNNATEESGARQKERVKGNPRSSGKQAGIDKLNRRRKD